MKELLKAIWETQQTTDRDDDGEFLYDHKLNVVIKNQEPCVWTLVTEKGMDIWQETKNSKEDAIEAAKEFINHLHPIERKHYKVSVQLLEFEFEDDVIMFNDAWESEEIK